MIRPPLMGRFLQFNLLFQVKVYFLYYKKTIIIIIVPLSCFCPHLGVPSWLVFYLEAFLSSLVWIWLLNFLSWHKFDPGEEKQKDCYLKKSYGSFSPKEFLRIFIQENEPKKYGTKNNSSRSLRHPPCFFVFFCSYTIN